MARRFRVAMVAACPFPAGRGTPIRIYRMAEGLARRGHEVEVVTYHMDQDVAAVSFGIRRTTALVSYRRRAPGPSLQKLMLLDPLLAATLFQVLRRRRYDLIHAHHVEGMLVAQLARMRLSLPVVFDVHTLLESELPFYGRGVGSRILSRIGHALDRHLPRRSDHVIAVSEEIRTKLANEHGIPAEAISVISNGIEAPFLTAARDQPQRTPATVLVYAGNLAPYQGIPLLLHAFAKALEQRPDLCLRIVCDGAFDGYASLAAELGIRPRIELVRTSLDELPAVLADSDIALNPRTVCDGLPQKLMNYMAVGLPIVSFAGSARHLTHGQTALIVPDNDVEAFADAILKLAAAPMLAHDLGQNARARLRDQAGWSRVAERTEIVYEQLVKA